MSMATEIAGFKAQVETLLTEKTDLAGKLEAAEKALADATVAHKAQMDALKEATDTTILGRTAERDAAKAAALEAVQQAEAAKGELAAAQTEITALKATLKNPAFSDAASKGASTVQAGGHAEGGTGGEEPQHYEAYKALRDKGEAKKATTYWREHETEIKAELAEIANDLRQNKA